MADISSYLAAIMAAVYGEDVRGSIHDAIDIINKVGEVVLNTGTAVTGPTSSSTGFYDGSFYINTNTMELWKCIGTDAWQSQGVLKGADGADGNGITSIVKTQTVGLVDTYTISFDDGSTETYQITNGQNGSKWYKGTAISGTGTSITGFPGTKDDFYLNSVDGFVYVCTKTGGAMVPDAAEWDYVMTLTGGGGGSITVIDNLISTSSTDALSANQGRVLNTSKIDNPSTKSDGQVLTYNGTSQKWEAQNPSGGGMLPYLYIDSEAGSTVTVNQPDGTVITPTAAGSDHWECELTGGYGTYVIHSVLAGQGDATQSLVVDTVMEYHVTDTHYDHTVSFVAPSGSTVRIEGGTEIYTLTGTGSTQTQAVHSASTSFTVTATMDGNGKPYTFTTPSTTGQTTTIPSGTFDFGTINVSVGADFVTAGSTITCVNGGTSCTPKTAASSLVFRVPTTGTWTISGTVSGTPYSVDAEVTSLSVSVSVELVTSTKADMYPFESATDAQLAAMLESYYNGDYDATDIATLKSTYLPIGAKRTIHLSQMAAYSPLDDTHFDASGADYEFVIIGHEHDDLVTPIGGKTKALLTLNQDRILYKNTTDTSYTTPSVADGFGKMNSTDTNVGGWKDSARRGWCNDTYFNALPLSIQGLVKTVQKLSSAGAQSSNIDTTNDKTFLLSGIEVTNTTTNTYAGEGTQYDYFATTTNRYKKPTQQSNLTGRYWFRSPASTGSIGFAYMYQSGTVSAGSATGVNGLTPAFCI